MATQNVQDVTSAADRVKVALAIAIALGGVVAYYALPGQPLVVRLLAIVAGLVAGGAVAWFSEPGRRFLAFVKDSWNEIEPRLRQFEEQVEGGFEKLGKAVNVTSSELKAAAQDLKERAKRIRDQLS